MAKQYPCCPNCGYNKKAGLGTGSYFDIYECKNCDKKFCYDCGTVKSGVFGSSASCPKCGSDNCYKDGEVQLR